MFHFIFVPLTLGLSILVAYMEWRYVKTGDKTWLRMANFWGKLFLINFALGIVTGITLEFQFGMNWAEYAKYVGDIFGAPLAIEATVAFFLESAFIGLWIFGGGKVSEKTHAFAITIVAFAANLSALWIILANGWMQHPVGFVLRNGRAEMVDFLALLTNGYGWVIFAHTLTSAYLLAAFFVMGISAWHLLHKNNLEFFGRSFRTAATFGLFALILVFVSGERSSVTVAYNQPEKLAAIEAQWETIKGAPYNILSFPITAEERNIELIMVPKLLSVLAFHDPEAEVRGLKSFNREDRPPVAPLYYGYRVMLGLGVSLAVLAILGWVYSRKGVIEEKTTYLKLMVFAIPLPYIAIELGWMVAEVGRQPWIVYHVMRTSEGVSQSVDFIQVAASLAVFTALYAILGAIDIYLLVKYAKKGPDDDGPAIRNA
ncbi:MAG: cytochrome ubiquinol oxidase subunit I [Syntrophales bacterium]|nr:cytochrome ubiquinol oxidase subunit I [Syntrophales bacterium]